MVKKTFTTYEISKICDVYISTVIDWIDEGKLPAYRTPGGHRRVKREDLIEFLKKHNFPIPEELREEKKKILIIDDDYFTIEYITSALMSKKNEFAVESATDYNSAISKLNSFRPELVILDVVLPGGSGIELLKLIKEKYQPADVIIITAYPSIKTVIEAMKLGSYDYITKPFDKVDFVSIISKCFEKREILSEPEKLSDLEAIYEISKAMGTMMELDKVLNLIVKLACDVLNADGSSIMLLDKENDELIVRATYGRTSEGALGERVKIGERISGYAIRTGEPVLVIGDAEKDPRFKDMKKYEDIKSSISAPLKVMGNVIGVINVKRIEKEEDYNEADIKLLTIFARDAAYAIEIAKLHSELHAKIEELRKLKNLIK